MKTKDELLKMPVKDFMDFAPTVASDLPLKALSEKFSGNNAVIVTDKTTGRFVGLITKTDLLKALDGGKATAQDIASTENIVGVKDNALVWQVIGTMNGSNQHSRRVDILPVVDGSKNFLGIVSRDNLKTRLDQFAAE